jgi:hypothetical protein
MGPMTGKGAGYCTGYDIPGWQNSLFVHNPARGRFQRFGGFSRGRVMGNYARRSLTQTLYESGTSPSLNFASAKRELVSLEKEKEWICQRIEQLKEQLTETGSLSED